MSTAQAALALVYFLDFTADSSEVRRDGGLDRAQAPDYPIQIRLETSYTSYTSHTRVIVEVGGGS
jgi:hypothetical protein